jgi:hypothetical protein
MIASSAELNQDRLTVIRPSPWVTAADISRLAGAVRAPSGAPRNCCGLRRRGRAVVNLQEELLDQHARMARETRDVLVCSPERPRGPVGQQRFATDPAGKPTWVGLFHGRQEGVSQHGHVRGMRERL